MKCCEFAKTHNLTQEEMTLLLKDCVDGVDLSGWWDYACEELNGTADERIAELRENPRFVLDFKLVRMGADDWLAELRSHLSTITM